MDEIDDCVVYVLQLENDKYYIGKTHNLNNRISQHFKNKGSEWTRLHKPISFIETSNEISEKEMTLKYMRKYGWSNVRGYCWCQTNLLKPPRCL